MEASSRPDRVDIGFSGGQTLAVRLPQEAYHQLRDAVSTEGTDRWIQLQTEDSQVLIDLAQVVYVRLDTSRERVGF